MASRSSAKSHHCQCKFHYDPRQWTPWSGSITDFISPAESFSCTLWCWVHIKRTTKSRCVCTSIMNANGGHFHSDIQEQQRRCINHLDRSQTCRTKPCLWTISNWPIKPWHVEVDGIKDWKAREKGPYNNNQITSLKTTRVTQSTAPFSCWTEDCSVHLEQNGWTFCSDSCRTWDSAWL